MNTRGGPDRAAWRDPVPRDAPGARAIGYDVPERYNASRLLFDNIDAGRGDKTAVFSPAGDATYAELAEAAGRAGAALLAAGLRHPDRVLMMLDDTAVYPAALFGALRAGLVPVLVNTQSPAELVRYYLEDSGARVAIVEGGLAGLFSAETVAGTALELLVVANADGGAAAPGVAVRSWEAWTSAGSGDLSEAVTTRDDMAFWMYSSGSTGRPKGIVHLHHDMAYTHASYARHVLQLTESDLCYSPPKIFFAYGLGNSVTFPFAVGAASVLAPGRPDPESVFAAIERYRPTVLFGLPTLYTALLAHDGGRERNLSSVRLCVSAAEVLSRDVFETWRGRYGHEIVEGLGSTEMLHIYLSNRVDAKRPGAAGLPVEGYEVVLRDAGGAEVGDGEPGILWVRGDSSAPCYWNKPDKTAETMRGSWICTGDRFSRDGDGFYYFQGRADDLIKVSGQWVYPLEIERCLADHAAVESCAVLGVALADRRMTTFGFVVLRDGRSGDETVTRALQDFVKSRLLPYKYPRHIAYLESLPMTGTNKVDRQALKARAEQALARQADADA